ncbi:MAG: hypothetical protein ACLTV6_04420 [Christensenellales bacterium]
MDKGRYRELCAFCRRYDQMRCKGETGAALIERAAKQADAAVAAAILQNVTQGMRFEYCKCYASKSAFTGREGVFRAAGRGLARRGGTCAIKPDEEQTAHRKTAEALFALHAKKTKPTD